MPPRLADFLPRPERFDLFLFFAMMNRGGPFNDGPGHEAKQDKLKFSRPDELPVKTYRFTAPVGQANVDWSVLCVDAPTDLVGFLMPKRTKNIHETSRHCSLAAKLL